MEPGVAALNTAGLVDPQANPYVRYQDQNALGADFSTVMEGVRDRANKFDNRMEKIADSQSDGSRNSTQMKQLVELYSYAVDTQLLVRTSNQLISGMRQLMTGQ